MDNLLKQGQNFTDTAGRTGVVNFDTQTGKPLATGQTTISPLAFSLPQNTNVNAGIIGSQTTPLPLPQTQTPVATPVPTSNLAQQYLNELALTENEKAAQSGQENIVAKMLENIAGQQGESAYRTEQIQNSGINTLRTDLQSINSQILKKQAEVAQDDIQLVANMRNEERRDTLLPFAQMGQAKLAGDAAIMRALKTSEIGVLNALALGKQGDIALAKDMVNEAVDAKFAPYKEQNALYEAQLKAIQPFLTSAEKKQANAQQFKLNQAVKEIDKVSDFQKTILSNAISSNAPQSVINAISKGQSIEEITKAGAGYLKSKAEILDEKLKNAQIANIYSNIDKTNQEIAAAKTPGGGKPATDTQITNAGYATRIAQANQVIDSNPSVFNNMSYAQFKLIESNSPIANRMLTPEQQQAAQAMRSFITAKLRKESGAAISPTEFADARSTYFPQLGDSQQVLAQKKETRDAVLNNNIQGAGPAYQSDPTDTYFKASSSIITDTTSNKKGTFLQEYNSRKK